VASRVTEDWPASFVALRCVTIVLSGGFCGFLLALVQQFAPYFQRRHPSFEMAAEWLSGNPTFLALMVTTITLAVAIPLYRQSRAQLTAPAAPEAKP